MSPHKLAVTRFKVLVPFPGGFRFQFLTCRVPRAFWPEMHCFHFCALQDGRVDLMNASGDFLASLHSISSLMFRIHWRGGLVMICCETLLHLILWLVLPRGLILQYVSTLITPPDSSETFSFDERDLIDAPLNSWVVSLFKFLSFRFFKCKSLQAGDLLDERMFLRGVKNNICLFHSFNSFILDMLKPALLVLLIYF